MEQPAENHRQELQKRYRITAIIVSAQILTMLILIALAWFVTLKSGFDFSASTITALWVAIVFIAVGTFVLRRILFSWEKLKNTTILKGISGLIAVLQTNAIILSALGELIAIIGFVIAVLSGNKLEMLRAGAVAMIIFLMNFPRRKVWEKIVVNLESAAN